MSESKTKVMVTTQAYPIARTAREYSRAEDIEVSPEWSRYTTKAEGGICKRPTKERPLRPNTFKLQWVDGRLHIRLCHGENRPGPVLPVTTVPEAYDVVMVFQEYLETSYKREPKGRRPSAGHWQPEPGMGSLGEMVLELSGYSNPVAERGAQSTTLPGRRKLKMRLEPQDVATVWNEVNHVIPEERRRSAEWVDELRWTAQRVDDAVQGGHYAVAEAYMIRLIAIAQHLSGDQITRDLRRRGDLSELGIGYIKVLNWGDLFRPTQLSGYPDADLGDSVPGTAGSPKGARKRYQDRPVVPLEYYLQWIERDLYGRDRFDSGWLADVTSNAHTYTLPTLHGGLGYSAAVSLGYNSLRYRQAGYPGRVEIEMRLLLYHPSEKEKLLSMLRPPGAKWQERQFEVHNEYQATDPGSDVHIIVQTREVSEAEKYDLQWVRADVIVLLPPETMIRIPKREKMWPYGSGEYFFVAAKPHGRVVQVKAKPSTLGGHDDLVRVYHGTTRRRGREIERSGRLRSAGEPHVYVTTDPGGGTYSEGGTGYGDGTVVELMVPSAALILDDEFPSGRKDYRIAVGRPGGSYPVTVVGVRYPDERLGDTTVQIGDAKVGARTVEVSDKVEYLKKLVKEGGVSPVVRAQAQEVVSGVRDRDDYGEMKAIWRWVKEHIRFTGDPVGREMVTTPATLLRTRQEDCDGIAALTGAMMSSVGIRVSLCFWAPDRMSPFKHVLAAGWCRRKRRWIPVDPSQKDRAFGYVRPGHLDCRPVD